MGAVADAVTAGGGETYGVITRALEASEVAHRGLTTLTVVVRAAHRDMVTADTGPGRLLDRLASWTPVWVSTWLDRAER